MHFAFFQGGEGLQKETFGNPQTQVKLYHTVLVFNVSIGDVVLICLTLYAQNMLIYSPNLL